MLSEDPLAGLCWQYERTVAVHLPSLQPPLRCLRSRHTKIQGYSCLSPHSLRQDPRLLLLASLHLGILEFRKVLLSPSDSQPLNISGVRNWLKRHSQVKGVYGIPRRKRGSLDQSTSRFVRSVLRGMGEGILECPTSYEVRPARSVCQPHPDGGSGGQAGVQTALDGGDVAQADGLATAGLARVLRGAIGGIRAPRWSERFPV